MTLILHVREENYDLFGCQFSPKSATFGILLVILHLYGMNYFFIYLKNCRRDSCSLKTFFCRNGRTFLANLSKVLEKCLATRCKIDVRRGLESLVSISAKLKEISTEKEKGGRFNPLPNGRGLIDKIYDF